MDEQQDDVERRLSAALHRMGSEARAPEGLWARIAPRLEDRVMVPGGWGRRFGMAAMGVAAALVLAVGGVGTVRVASRPAVGVGGRWLRVTELLRTGRRAGDRQARPAPTRSWPSKRMTKRRHCWRVLSEPTAVPRPQLADSAVPRPQGVDSTELGWSLTDGGGLEARQERIAVDVQGSAGERQIVSQASLTIEVRNVNAATIQLRGLVESTGGFIEHISTSGGPNPEFGSAGVRVPGERFVETLDRIEGLGRPLEQSLGQRDVTGQVIDLEARLRSERSAEQSLLKLLDRAASVTDVLTVERELARVRATVERLQGELEYLQRSVALATIAVSFTLPPGAVTIAPSASMQIEVGDVEGSVRRVRDLVGGAGGRMEQVTVSTRTNGQDAFLSFEAPASAFESLLTSLAGDGVIIYREVRSDGRLPSAGSDDDLQARFNVTLQTPEESDLWGDVVLPAGGALAALLIVVVAALAICARRRRAA